MGHILPVGPGAASGRDTFGTVDALRLGCLLADLEFRRLAITEVSPDSGKGQ